MYLSLKKISKSCENRANKRSQPGTFINSWYTGNRLLAPPFEFLKVPKAMIVTVTAKLVAALAAIPFRTGAAAGGDGGARAAERRRRSARPNQLTSMVLPINSRS